MSLTSPCPEAQLGVVRKTDAGGIAFGPDDFITRGPLCSVESMERFRRVLSALDGVEAWEHAGAGYDLVGSGGIRLVEIGVVAPTTISRGEVVGDRPQST